MPRGFRRRLERRRFRLPRCFRIGLGFWRGSRGEGRREAREDFLGGV